MSKILIFVLIFICGEIVATIIFKIIQYSLEENPSCKIDRAVIKGVLERLFIFLALIYKFPQALIAFAAIKIGARFKEEESKISNDYFYIGNITSLLFAILYFMLWNHIVS